VAERCSGEVFAGPVVAYAGKESDELGVVLVAAHEHLAILLGQLARAEIVGAEAVVGEVLVLGAEARILRILVGVARHGLDVVLAEVGVVVCEPLEDILALFRVGA